MSFRSYRADLFENGGVGEVLEFNVVVMVIFHIYAGKCKEGGRTKPVQPSSRIGSPRKSGRIRGNRGDELEVE
jgi:hypothetical protein